MAIRTDIVDKELILEILPLVSVLIYLPTLLTFAFHDWKCDIFRFMTVQVLSIHHFVSVAFECHSEGITLFFVVAFSILTEMKEFTGALDNFFSDGHNIVTLGTEMHGYIGF